MPRNKIAAEVAASVGALETLGWLATNSDGPAWDAGILRAAARGGHIDVLQYARFSLGLPWDGSVCANAGSAGNLAALQWLRKNGCPWDKMCTAWAELNGHSAVKEWALANGCDWSPDLILRMRLARVMSQDNR